MLMKDFNKITFVDNDGENMLLLKTPVQDFEINVKSLCNQKQLPIDSFTLTEINSVTIKGLNEIKMEFAINTFDTLYNLLLKNNNIIVGSSELEILQIFQKSFEYNLIGLKKKQNSELSDFLKTIIKNNKQ